MCYLLYTHYTWTHAGSAISPHEFEILDGILENIPFFRKLPTDMRRYIFEHMKYEYLAADSVIFQEGDPGDNLFINIQGSVGIHIHPKDNSNLAKAKLDAMQIHRELGGENIDQTSVTHTHKNTVVAATESPSDTTPRSDKEDDGAGLIVTEATAKQERTRKLLRNIRMKLRIKSSFDERRRLVAKTEADIILNQRAKAKKASAVQYAEVLGQGQPVRRCLCVYVLFCLNVYRVSAAHHS
jgi:hypothetical protein